MLKHLSGHRERGMTLVEIAVGLVILLLLSGAVFQFTAAAARADNQERATIQAQQEARRALDAISADIMEATGNSLDLVAPGLPGSAGPVATFQGQTLFFQTTVWDGLAPWPGPTYQYAWVQNGNESVIQRTVTEIDSNGNGAVDPFEDINADGVLAPITTVVARNINNEDGLGDNNGVWAAIEDLNNDNRQQFGLTFIVTQEDINNDNILNSFEDLNGNGRNDATVTIAVDTVVLPGVPGIVGQQSMSTTVQIRNT